MLVKKKGVKGGAKTNSFGFSKRKNGAMVIKAKKVFGFWI